MKISLRDRTISLRRFANRLARDVTGNTLVMVAAAIIPLAALVGSGVDMSRAYMAQSRLQMACDAGALAGRRAMTTGAVDQIVHDEALKFFRFNFPTGESASTTPPYGVASFTPTVADGTDSAVVITASTTVPTTIMRMFGYNNVPISVTCNAKQDFVNTDVMLVLDNTGSMSQDTNGVEQYSGTTSKIVGMRQAVMALYTELKPTQTLLESHGLRLRYGIVPYSVAVNVGKVLPTSYLKSDNWDYQSRVADYTTEVYVPSDTAITNASDPLLIAGYPPGTQRYKTTAGVYNYTGTDTAISSTNCGRFGSNNNTFTGFNPSPSGTTLYDPEGAAGLTITAPTAPTAYVKYTFARLTAAWSNNPANRVCDRTVTVTRRTYTIRYKASGNSAWKYQQATNSNGTNTAYDVSGFIAGSAVPIATNTRGTVAVSGTYNMAQIAALASTTTTNGYDSSGNSISVSGVSTTTSSWDGCVEEPQTTWTLPDNNALDLSLKSVPTSAPASQWKPYWDDISYYPSSKSGSGCPGQVARLKVWDSATLQTYLDGLVAAGNTYSDIGMMWGGRLLSTTGVFASDNPATYNNMQVARYVILMTDGYINTTGTTYSGYGVEQYDHRVSGASFPGNTTDTANHYTRFSMICNIVKSLDADKLMSPEIWVIGYGSGVSMDSALQGCATDTTKAFQAANTAALIAKFKEIAKDIGALRLTK